MQKIYIKNVSKELLNAIIKEYKAKKILIVHSIRSYQKTGLKDIFEQAINQENRLDFTVFKENPKWEDILKGINIAKKYNPDLIFAIGGGSAMDTAKLIRFFFSHFGSAKDYSKEALVDLIPIVAIPTTFGTGAESTRFAICYQDGLKQSVTHDDILPNATILDYNLFATASNYVKACTGLDALCQAIESFWSKKASAESRFFAKKAIQLIFPILSKRELYNQKLFLMAMLMGSNFAGRAINYTSTTTCHAFSYRITQLLNYPHGHAVASSLPYFFGLLKGTDVYNQLCKILDIDKENAKDILKDYVINIFDDLYQKKMPTKEQFDEIISVVNQDRLKNYPIELKEMPSISDFLF